MAHSEVVSWHWVPHHERGTAGNHAVLVFLVVHVLTTARHVLVAMTAVHMRVAHVAIRVSLVMTKHGVEVLHLLVRAAKARVMLHSKACPRLKTYHLIVNVSVRAEVG